MDGLDFNLADYMKFVLAFIFVLSLIGLATVAGASVSVCQRQQEIQPIAVWELLKP